MVCIALSKRREGGVVILGAIGVNCDYLHETEEYLYPPKVLNWKRVHIVQQEEMQQLEGLKKNKLDLSKDMLKTKIEFVSFFLEEEGRRP